MKVTNGGKIGQKMVRRNRALPALELVLLLGVAGIIKGFFFLTLKVKKQTFKHV